MTVSSTVTQNPLLHVLKETIVSLVSADDTDLSARQLGVLMTVYLEMPDGGHTVRGLAAKLKVSKPAITRALDRLSEFDFVRRKKDPTDARSVLVEKTAPGSAYIRNLGKVMNAAQKATTEKQQAAA